MQGSAKDFDPWLAVSALKGLTEALYWQLTEGDAANAALDSDTHARLVGLTWAARRLAHELHAYLQKASENGLELPAPSDSNGIAEIRPPYRVN